MVASREAKPRAQLTKLADTSVRRIAGIGALLVAAISVIAVWMIADSRTRILHEAERELGNTALLLARQFDRTFEELYANQSEIGAVLEQAFTPAGSQSTHNLLKLKAGDTGGFNLIDRSGRLVNSSRAWPAPSVDIGNDADFRRWMTDVERTESNVEFARDPVNGEWSLALIQRLHGLTAESSGLLTRIIPSSWYQNLAASITLGDDAAIAVFTTDGRLVARWPRATAALGQRFDDKELLPLFQDASLTKRVFSPFDGTERMVSARRLTKQPITVTVSRSVEKLLSPWMREIAVIVSVAVATALAMAVVLFRLGRQVLRQQAKVQHRYSVALNNMSHGLTLFDASGRLLLRNQRYLDIYRLSADAVKPGIHADDIYDLLRKVGRDLRLIEQYRSTALKNAAARHSFEAEFTDGRTILITREPIQGGGWVTTHEEITERKRADSRIHHLAHYDDLTGLPNRSSFRGHLDNALKNIEPGDALALLYIDIDEFKTVNDTLGHPVGDALLKALAGRLRSCIGAADYVARLGGDEFAVIKASTAGVQELAELIHLALRDTIDCNGHTISTDVSIGIAIAPDDGCEVDQLIAKADLALYAAKAEGRRTYRFFMPEMDTRAKARHELATELRRAVAERAFELHFQPLVHLDSGEMAGCEALLRWRHPIRGNISPGEFIPLAEEIGLIEELGEWVLDEACRVAAGWPAHMVVAVNVSPIQFKRATFPLKVAAALARSGLSAQRLELEITEALLLQDDESTLSTLTGLRDLGLKIALDDFGTGYSSLSYLHRFPIDKIKIDKSFVDTITSEGGSSTIIQAIVQIAASGNKVTLAEGVETFEQRERLKQLGCHQMQGYLFSPALPAHVLAELIDGSAKHSRQTA